MQGLGLQTRPQTAHAHAHLDARLRQLTAEASGEHAPAGGVGVREHQRELVSTDPVRAVAGPRLLQDVGHALEHRVPVEVPVLIVQPLEVVDVEDGQGERFVIAHRGGDRRGQLILEGTLIGQIGQPVACRALQAQAVVAHQPSPAQEVEEREPAHESGHADDREDFPHVRDLPVVDAVVVGHLVAPAPAEQPHRGDELQVARIEFRVVLVARREGSPAQRGEHRWVEVVQTHHLVVSRRADHAPGFHQQGLAHAGTA